MQQRYACNGYQGDEHFFTEIYAQRLAHKNPSQLKFQDFFLNWGSMINDWNCKRRLREYLTRPPRYKPIPSRGINLFHLESRLVLVSHGWKSWQPLCETAVEFWLLAKPSVLFFLDVNSNSTWNFEMFSWKNWWIRENFHFFSFQSQQHSSRSQQKDWIGTALEDPRRSLIADVRRRGDHQRNQYIIHASAKLGGWS